MTKKAIRNMGIFILFVIISGWIGVLVDSVLIDQPGSSPIFCVNSSGHGSDSLS